jgi:hypothetical protein
MAQEMEKRGKPVKTKDSKTACYYWILVLRVISMGPLQVQTHP